MCYISGCDNILHGRGNQYKLTKEYLDLRNDGLSDRTQLTDEELSKADITEVTEGYGDQKYIDTYYKYNVPIPADRSKKKIDRRDVYGELGEKTR